MRFSYSQYQTYKQCPFKWKCKNVLKLSEPFVGPAAERGTMIHNILEDYITKKADRLPWDVEGGVDKVPALGEKHSMHPVLVRLREWPDDNVHVEYKVEFDIDWNPWPANKDDVAWVVVFDAVTYRDGTVTIYEWKSGRLNMEHLDQRLLYILAALKLWEAKQASATTFYVDIPLLAHKTSAPAEALQELMDMWGARRETIMNDKILAPRPHSNCRWCHFRKSNGGPCPMSY